MSLENKIAALEAQADIINKPSTYMDICDDEDTILLDVDEIPLPPLPSYLALNHTPSPSPSPLPETIVSLPRRFSSPLPPFVPSPSRQLPTEVRPPTFHDISNQNHVLKKHSVVTKSSTPRFSPYSKAQSNVKKTLKR